MLEGKVPTDRPGDTLWTEASKQQQPWPAASCQRGSQKAAPSLRFHLLLHNLLLQQRPPSFTSCTPGLPPLLSLDHPNSASTSALALGSSPGYSTVQSSLTLAEYYREPLSMPFQSRQQKKDLAQKPCDNTECSIARTGRDFSLVCQTLIITIAS